MPDGLPSTDSPLSIALPHLAVLTASGPDTVDFLHGQLTQDIRGLPDGQARLAGYCTPKGRLLATMVVWKKTAAANVPAQDPAVCMLVHASVADTLQKRLAMFVLRAKVKLEHSTFQVAGVMPRAQGAAAMTPWQVQETNHGLVITCPGEVPRQWLLHNADAPAPEAEPEQLALWQALDIAAGLPWITAATQDTFIPQTVNLDLIDGVNFTKGCYPGQEVVARAHYRGAVKRRMARAIGPLPETAEVPEGSDTWLETEPDNPCGRVVNATVLPGDAAGLPAGLHVLMEVQLADLTKNGFRAVSPEGPPLALAPLPVQLQPAD